MLITAKNKDISVNSAARWCCYPRLSNLNHGNLISPQFPILVMLDIIYSYYVEQDKYQKEVLMTIHCGHSRKAGQSTGICLNR